MGGQETWEVLLLPVGEDAGRGTASVNNMGAGPASGLRVDVSAEADTNGQAATRRRLANQ